MNFFPFKFQFVDLQKSSFGFAQFREYEALKIYFDFTNYHYNQILSVGQFGEILSVISPAVQWNG